MSPTDDEEREQAQPLLLIVEDDEAFARTLARSFERRGYRVLQAASLPEVETLLAQHTPGFAVVDLKLKGEVSGLACVQKLHAASEDMLIVVLTGFASIATAVEAVNLGACHYLAKPSNTDDIEAAFGLKRLLLTQRMRDFAVSELKLPDNASYRRYADLERGAVVWNVVAAPELSLTLKTWCFPVLGCVGYRGYFSREEADALATQLKAEGWEVSVYGVPAYSTLGWSNWMGGDPLLNTFVLWPEGELARLVFHELAHQVAYADDDTTFIESFATAVERLGGRRWLEQRATPQARAEYAALDARRQDFRALTLKVRGELEAVYASALPDAAKRERKADVLAAMRDEYATLKTTRWGGFAGYDGWFARANNAAFGVQAAYFELVPAFEQRFERSGGDLERFYADVRQLAALPKDERRAKLLASP